MILGCQTPIFIFSFSNNFRRVALQQMLIYKRPSTHTLHLHTHTHPTPHTPLMPPFLVGDTNCDFKCIRNINANKLKFIYSEFQLEQLVKSYTRVAVTNSENGDLMTKRDKMKKAATKNPLLWPTYKRLRNQCTCAIRTR